MKIVHIEEILCKTIVKPLKRLWKFLEFNFRRNARWVRLKKWAGYTPRRNFCFKLKMNEKWWEIINSFRINQCRQKSHVTKVNARNGKVIEYKFFMKMGCFLEFNCPFHNVKMILKIDILLMNQCVSSFHEIIIDVSFTSSAT